MWLKWGWLLCRETLHLFKNHLKRAQQGVLIIWWIVALTEIVFAYARFTGKFHTEESAVLGAVHSALFGCFVVGSVYLIHTWSWTNHQHEVLKRAIVNDEMKLAAARSVIQDITSMFANIPDGVTIRQVNLDEPKELDEGGKSE